MVRETREDTAAFAKFMVEYLGESGRDGSAHFAVASPPSSEDIECALRARIGKRLDEALWGRAWILVEPSDGRVVGHAELLGGRCPSERHRATMGVGVLHAYTRQGHGKRLLDSAVRWAREQGSIDWIDLCVFSTNLLARTLYKRVGFVDTGFRQDAYRLDSGASVDDIHMVLRLR
jgi:ribosomal protein S18 acetylase RimI-like enzyme